MAQAPSKSEKLLKPCTLELWSFHKEISKLSEIMGTKLITFIQPQKILIIPFVASEDGVDLCGTGWAPTEKERGRHNKADRTLIVSVFRVLLANS